MFKPRTVFVVGAGAGFDIDMPLGDALKEQISQLLRVIDDPFVARVEDKAIRIALQVDDRSKHRMSAFHNAALTISRGLPVAASIDNYLHTHKLNPEIQFCGKLAIARAISRAEGLSKLRVDLRRPNAPIDLAGSSKFWLSTFATRIFEGVELKNLEHVFESIDIICFNYDRCIEHFLLSALQIYFDLNLKDASDILSTLRIFHPYGTIGNLAVGDEVPGVGFGEELVGEGLIAAADRIRTFTEETDDQGNLQAIKAAIGSAHNLVFLGFGYIPQNMKLLDPSALKISEKPQIFGTAVNISLNDRKQVSSQIRGWYKKLLKDFVLDDSDCTKLLNDNRFSLSV